MKHSLTEDLRIFLGEHMAGEQQALSVLVSGLSEKLDAQQSCLHDMQRRLESQCKHIESTSAPRVRVQRYRLAWADRLELSRGRLGAGLRPEAPAFVPHSCISVPSDHSLLVQEVLQQQALIEAQNDSIAALRKELEEWQHLHGALPPLPCSAIWCCDLERELEQRCFSQQFGDFTSWAFSALASSPTEDVSSKISQQFGDFVSWAFTAIAKLPRESDSGNAVHQSPMRIHIEGTVLQQPVVARMTDDIQTCMRVLFMICSVLANLPCQKAKPVGVQEGGCLEGCTSPSEVHSAKSSSALRVASQEGGCLEGGASPSKVHSSRSTSRFAVCPDVTKVSSSLHVHNSHVSSSHTCASGVSPYLPTSKAVSFSNEKSSPPRSGRSSRLIINSKSSVSEQSEPIFSGRRADGTRIDQHGDVWGP